MVPKILNFLVTVYTVTYFGLNNLEQSVRVGKYG
jgi:hypothetical protein